MSNNALHNHDCPDLMEDGRKFTDFRPSCYVHDLIIKQNGITNSYDLKNFLQCNAVELQKINTNYYMDKLSCKSCGCFYLADPNDNDTYWQAYNKHIGYESSTMCAAPNSIIESRH